MLAIAAIFRRYTTGSLAPNFFMLFSGRQLTSIRFCLPGICFSYQSIYEELMKNSATLEIVMYIDQHLTDKISRVLTPSTQCTLLCVTCATYNNCLLTTSSARKCISFFSFLLKVRIIFQILGFCRNSIV